MALATSSPALLPVGRRVTYVISMKQFEQLPLPPEGGGVRPAHRSFSEGGGGSTN